MNQNCVVLQQLEMCDAQQVPRQIREQVHQVINLLLLHGLEYESTLAEASSPPDFLFPKSKYYRYYTSQLFEHGPNSRSSAYAPRKGNHTVRVEGNLESMSVGAMTEIIKNQIAEGNNRDYYHPFENEYYDESIELAPTNENIKSKIESFIEKFGPLLQKKPKAKDKEKEKEKEKKEGRQDDARKQTGTNHDGSLGAYGGKKYEGLGARDQFDAFRREKSQSYYQSLQEKSK